MTFLNKSITTILSIRNKRKKKYLSIFNNTSSLKKLESLINHKPILDRKTEKSIFINIKYWKTNYYMYHFFNNTYNPSYDTLLINNINNICKYYLESIYWTINYYINGCIAYRWHNPYNFAPSLVHVYNYY